MANPQNSSFILSNTPEFHQQRRKEILAKYPEIRALFGPEKKTKYIVLLLITSQFGLAFYTQQLGWFWWFIILYTLGATISHSLFAAIHELTHHLAFRSKLANRAFALLSNLALGIPMAMGFEKYHFIHHRFLGHPQKDVDIPYAKEAQLFRSTRGKLLWVLLQPFTYAIRPFIKLPQKITTWEWLNLILQITFDLIVVGLFGWSFLAFLILSTLISMSLHPTAAHTIAEHYIVNPTQETYSYYGPLNYLLFNVGYHVEHHDFPTISWTKIHRLRKIAPEYYDSLHVHKSWIAVIGQFIFSKKINLFARIVRPDETTEMEVSP